MKNISINLIIIILTTRIFSQESNFNEITIGSFLTKEDKKNVLYLSSKWQQQIQSLAFESQENITDSIVDFENDDSLSKQICRIDSNTPFQFKLTSSTEKHIKSLIVNKKNYIERIQFRGSYYFPIIEEALLRYKLPLELKYLAVVESALNPTANSHAGAVGIWQFMYHTGKLYNLNVTSYIDERKDPLKASEAAAHHLFDLYNLFKNWDLALAAYNAGVGNVNKAIARADSKDFWVIQKYLPIETQNYVPRFYATLYLFEQFGKEYKNIKNYYTVYNVDTVLVKKELKIDELVHSLEIQQEVFTHLNPSYYNAVIPKNSYIVLPIDFSLLFVKYEDRIYKFIQQEVDNSQLVDSKHIDTINKKNSIIKTIQINEKTDFIYYVVKKGDNLNSISKKYSVTVEQIKKWNQLKSNKVLFDSKLKIYSNQKKVTNKNSGVKYHIVKSGENITVISKKYKITVSNLKSWNNLKGETIFVGQKLIIKR